MLMSTDGTQLSMPELVRRIANLWDSWHVNQMAKDSYKYGGYMKESTVKRFLHKEINKLIQGLLGICVTPHIITGPPTLSQLLCLLLHNSLFHINNILKCQGNPDDQWFLYLTWCLTMTLRERAKESWIASLKRPQQMNSKAKRISQYNSFL
jgi:hypothetical protein